MIQDTHAWRFKVKGERKITYWYLKEITRYTHKLSTSQTETFFQSLGTGITFKSGSEIEAVLIDYKRDLIFNDWNLHSSIVIPAGYHEMTGHELLFQSAQTGKFTYNLATRFADFYGGRLARIYPSLDYIFNRYFRINVLYDYVRINFPKTYADPGDNVYESHLVSGSIAVTLSPYFSIKLLSQYDNLSSTVGSNLRIRYNPKEGTDLYIVYNSGMLTNASRLDPHPPVISNQAVTVKFSKTFGL